MRVFSLNRGARNDLALVRPQVGCVVHIARSVNGAV
jgi:hypothetical protein